MKKVLTGIRSLRSVHRKPYNIFSEGRSDLYLRRVHKYAKAAELAGSKGVPNAEIQARALGRRVTALLRFRRYRRSWKDARSFLLESWISFPQINFPFNALRKGKETEECNFSQQPQTCEGAGG